MIVYDSNLKYFYSTVIQNEGFFAGFTTRDLGDGRKASIIERFLKNNNFPYKQLVLLEQIHSVNISTYESKVGEQFKKIEEVDGVVSREAQAVLAVRTADCPSMIFADGSNGVMGISHQGWRGSLKKMAVRMVERMVKLGGDLDTIKVAIGPAIGECCYDVEDDRYYEFLEEAEGYAKDIFTMRRGRWHLNLALLNYLLLVSAGIKKENIDHFPFCTKCDKKRFFSFRRDNSLAEGEMFSFIAKSV